jgi:LPXTG-site transpeptidase (sortase) family protein
MTEVPATATATSRSEQNPSPTTAAGVDVSSPVAFIADTGVLPTPTVSKKKDKFENFSVPVSGESAFSLLPLTGFPKDILSVIEPQPADKKYSTTDVTVEIPSLGINLPVMGVPKKEGTWDVSWLTDQAGWLEGTAFPSWSGNSVLTAHFYMASGLPGPFVNLSTMGYGDQIIVHAFGQTNIFEVQTNEEVEPDAQSILKHEENAWLTLITCAEYVAETATYNKRTVVRAVLVVVE